MTKIVCVDLDGTLWKGDCLILNIFQFIKTKPWFFYKIFIWWYQGRQVLKNKLSHFWNKPFINFYPSIIGLLQKYHKNGAVLYLVTGSDQKIADDIKLRLPIFSDAFGSNINLNLVGKNKADFLVNKFGSGNFLYLGNDKKDINVWKHSSQIVAVNPDKKALKWILSNDPQKYKIFYVK